MDDYLVDSMHKYFSALWMAEFNKHDKYLEKKKMQTPTEKHNPEVGALYLSEDGHLRRVDSNAEYSYRSCYYSKWLTGRSVQRPVNRPWHEFTKVTRDDPRVIAILGPVEPYGWEQDRKAYGVGR